MNLPGASDICLALMVAMMSSIISIAILLTHNAVFDFRIDEGTGRGTRGSRVILGRGRDIYTWARC